MKDEVVGGFNRPLKEDYQFRIAMKNCNEARDNFIPVRKLGKVSLKELQKILKEKK